MKISVVKQWMTSILEGLDYLHKRNVIHGDLTCSKIYTEGGGRNIKIGGLEKNIIYHCTQDFAVDGTPGTMPPESSYQIPDEKADIYAFGMCVLHMFTFARPYDQCQTTAEVVRLQLENRKPRALAKIKDPVVLEFIEACLEPDPTLRPSVADLLEHALLTDDRKDEELMTSVLSPTGSISDLESLYKETKKFTKPRPFIMRREDSVKSLLVPEEEDTDNDSPYYKQYRYFEKSTTRKKQGTSMSSGISELEYRADESIKCFFDPVAETNGVEIIRVYLNEMGSVQHLVDEMLEGFDILLPEVTRIKYKDEEGDLVTINLKKTTMREICDHAKSIHIYTKNKNKRYSLGLGLTDFDQPETKKTGSGSGIANKPLNRSSNDLDSIMHSVSTSASDS